ncbi:aarF domain-containing kinase [Pyronema omphalodes]|nr:aarF domain-containing kinase [Pyronema omphalodes]
MASRRLLDLCAIANASSAIAKKHFLIRRHQLNIYAATSSLGRSLRASQRPHYEASESRSQSQPEGVAQDHHYTPGAGNTSNPQPQSDLNVNQNSLDSRPFPASETRAQTSSQQATHTVYSAPSSHTTPPPPSVAKKLQHESEHTIPRQTADPPTTEKLSEGKNDEVFYEQHGKTSEVLSNLPRAKIPHATATDQGSQTAEGVDADVFMREEQPRTQPEAKEDEKELEELGAQVFHSRRARGIVSGKLGPIKMPTKQPGEQRDMRHPAMKSFESVMPVASTVASAAIASAEAMTKEEKEVVKSFESVVPPSSAASPAATAATDSAETSSLPSASEAEKSFSPVLPASAEKTHSAAEVLQTPSTAAPTKEVKYETVKKAEIDDMAAEIAAATSAEPEKPTYKMKASHVPSSRFGRLFHYGGLAAGMAWGAASESVRRVAGGAGDAATSVMFSERNVERLVEKLSRMRGAALKLGQMMSIQDNMLPAPLLEVLARVQDAADYMPASQRDQVLVANLGENWRELFAEFEEVPMAAASIGQVHAARLASTGTRVAVKIQYPGVATSISSDLNNLAVLLSASKILPKGLYLDKTIANARTELGWECDYVREAECAKRFAKILEGESDVFRVPKVYDEASGPQVLTMEMMEGTAVTKTMKNLSQEERDFIGTQILGLCFREIAKYKFMQTDPNWTNFLWNAKDKKIELLDFGASREYPDHFISLYTSVLRAAAKADFDACRRISIDLGYLTGLESEGMTRAHVTSILTLAEPFSVNAPEIYDFSDQTVTARVKAQIPLMIRERLAPPPEETYSLHRKLSGAFLLCARLGSRVPCRKIFVEALGE